MKKIDRETYCKDCDRSIYGKSALKCDKNIENNGKYDCDWECSCKVNRKVKENTYENT